LDEYSLVTCGGKSRGRSEVGCTAPPNQKIPNRGETNNKWGQRVRIVSEDALKSREIRCKGRHSEKRRFDKNSEWMGR